MWHSVNGIHCELLFCPFSGTTSTVKRMWSRGVVTWGGCLSVPRAGWPSPCRTVSVCQSVVDNITPMKHYRTNSSRSEPYAQYTPPTRRNCRVASCRRCEHTRRQSWPSLHVQCESKKSLHWGLVAIFPKRLGIFQPNFTCLLWVPIYTTLRMFIQLPATVTKLCHIKCDHPVCVSTDGGHFEHIMVVVLNMAKLHQSCT